MTLAIAFISALLAAPPVVIRAERLFDGRGKVLTDAVVIVEGDRIKAVGSKLEIPKDATVVDLGSVTLLPGLVDAHTHLLTQLRASPDPIDLLPQLQSTARRTLQGASRAREMLDAGFTTVRDLGNAGDNGDVALRDAIAAGDVPGPRMLVSTRILSAVGGQFDPGLSPQYQALSTQEYVHITGVEEARRAVRRAIVDGADVIKIVVGRDFTMPVILGKDEVTAIVEEAHRHGKKVAAHAMDEAATSLAVDAGVDSIEHGQGISDETLRKMAKRGTFLVPTDYDHDDYRVDVKALGASDLKIEKRIADRTDRMKRARAAGVRVAFGSDSMWSSGGRDRGDSALRGINPLVLAGYAPKEILRSLTSEAAECLGLADRIGTLEPGKTADLIAVPGDPLADLAVLSRVSFVMHDGIVVRRDAAAR